MLLRTRRGILTAIAVIAVMLSGISPSQGTEDPGGEGVAMTPARNLVAIVSGPRQVTVSWESPSNVDSFPVLAYNVDLQSESGEKMSQSVSGTNTSFNDLRSGVNYRVTVRPLRSSGESWPITTSFTSPSPPEPVTNLVDAEVTSSSITLGWSAPLSDGGARLTGYFVSDDKGLGDFVSSTNWTLDGLNPSTTYSFKVFAVNELGYSAPTPISVETLPLPAAPNRPTDLRVIESTSTRLTIAWKPPAQLQGAQIRNYRIYVDERYVDDTGIDATTEFTIENLKPNRNYLVGVTTVSLGGQSTPATVLAKTKEGTPAPPTPPPSPPSQPGNLQAQPVGKTSIQLNWDPPPGTVTDYVVKRDGGPAVTVTGSGFIADDLRRGTEYTFSVIARNDVGESQPARVSAATLYQPAPRPSAPLAPTNLSLASATTTTVTITWDEPLVAGAIMPTIKYWVRVGDGPAVSVSDRIYTATQLQPGTQVEVSVIAENSMGQSPPASITAQTELSPVPNPLPSPPRSLRVVAVTDTSVLLDWLRPTGSARSTIVGYQVTWPGSQQSTTVTSADLTGLQPSTDYTFSVAALSDSGLSSPVSVQARTHDSPPPDPKPAPQPRPDPGLSIGPMMPDTNDDRSFDADHNARTLQQVLPGRWPAKTLTPSGRDLFLENSSRMTTNAGQVARVSVTDRSPSIRSARVVFDKKKRKYVLRAVLQPSKKTGSVIVSVDAPLVTVDGVTYEPLHASKRFVVVPPHKIALSQSR